MFYSEKVLCFILYFLIVAFPYTYIFILSIEMLRPVLKALKKELKDEKLKDAQ